MNYSSLLTEVVKSAYLKLEAIDIDKFNLKPSDNKWSQKEILGHLIDSCFVNLRRVVLAQAAGEYIFEGYDQDAWVNKNNYQNRAANEVITTWRASNLHLAASIKGIPQEILNEEKEAHNFHKIAMKQLPISKPATLSYLIADYIYHQEYHLNQIISSYTFLGYH